MGGRNMVEREVVGIWGCGMNRRSEMSRRLMRGLRIRSLLVWFRGGRSECWNVLYYVETGAVAL